MNYSLSDTPIIISLIMNFILTLLILWISIRTKRVKNTFMGLLMGIIMGIMIFFAGLTVALVTTLVISYPLEPFLVILFSIVPFALPLCAFLGLKLKRSR